MAARGVVGVVCGLQCRGVVVQIAILVPEKLKKQPQLVDFQNTLDSEVIKICFIFLWLQTKSTSSPKGEYLMLFLAQS